MKKSCVRLFRHRQTLFRRNRPLLLPAFLLLRLRLHGQAGKPPFMNLPRRLLRAHTFCVPGGRSAPLCTRSKMTAAPALAVSKIAGEKTKTGGMLYEKMQPVLSQWTVVFLVAALNFITAENRSTAVVWLCLGSAFLCLGASQRKNKAFLQPRRWKNLAGAAILCGACSYSRQNDQISTKTRYAYVNQINPFHCRDPL